MKYQQNHRTMTDEQLTALAREYAEEMTAPISFEAYASPEFQRELHTRGCANEAKEVLNWLLRRFCLVEKSKVLKSLIQARALIEVGRRNHDNIKEDLGTRSERTIYCLFPEIAKEVES